MNLTFVDILLGSALGSGLVHLLIQFLGKFFTEWRENSIRRQKEKRACLDKVIAICTEASSNTYNKPPRDGEHILRTITDLEAYDKKLAKLLERLFTNWQLLAGFLLTEKQKSSLDSSENRHKLELIRGADEVRIELIKQCQRKRG